MNRQAILAIMAAVMEREYDNWDLAIGQASNLLSRIEEAGPVDGDGDKTSPTRGQIYDRELLVQASLDIARQTKRIAELEAELQSSFTKRDEVITKHSKALDRIKELEAEVEKADYATGRAVESLAAERERIIQALLDEGVFNYLYTPITRADLERIINHNQGETK